MVHTSWRPDMTSLSSSPPWKPALALFALALGACAPALEAAERAERDSAGRACFFARNVSGFSAPDDQTLYLRVGVRDIYEMQMFAPCPEMDWAQGLAIQSRGGSTICQGMDATIIASGTLGPQRCQVRAVRRLTEAEAAALPPGRRP